MNADLVATGRDEYTLVEGRVKVIVAQMRGILHTVRMRHNRIEVDICWAGQYQVK